MQNQLWMKPALLSSEAVLLPALERQYSSRSRQENRRLLLPQAADAFQPADTPWEETRTASAYPHAHPHGSMAGRSVLRAAGLRSTPVSKRCRRCR